MVFFFFFFLKIVGCFLSLFTHVFFFSIGRAWGFKETNYFRSRSTRKREGFLFFFFIFFFFFFLFFLLLLLLLLFFLFFLSFFFFGNSLFFFFYFQRETSTLEKQLEMKGEVKKADEREAQILEKEVCCSS